MLGKRLKKLREQFGYTQQQLADLVSLSQQTIGHYEVGRADPDIDTLKLFADIFGTTADYLLGRTDLKNSTACENGPPFGFTSPKEIVEFILTQNIIMDFIEFDTNKLSDDEVKELVNELLNLLKLLSYKYKR